MQIAVLNNSEDRRSGVVTVSWKALIQREKVTPKDVIVRKGKEAVLSQIDEIDPDDADRTVVSIRVDDVPASGDSLPAILLTPEFLATSNSREGGPTVMQTKQEHTPPVPIAKNDPPPAIVQLKNEYLHASLQIPKGPFGWQGGAVTSVRLFNREILDAFRAEEDWQGQDPEKRVQADYVSVPRPPWSDDPAQRFALFNEDWQYVTSGSGPVRAFVTIKSPPFTAFHGPDGLEEKVKKDTKYDDVKYDSHLYRVISLYAYSDFLVEEMYVRGKRRSDNTPVSLSFASHYFLKMRVGVPPPIRRIPDNDWFSIGATKAPLQGYGFAATVPVGRVENPPDDYPNEKEKWWAFGWSIGFGREVRALHLFKRGLLPHQVADETGRHWFDVIYNPMRATAMR